MFKKVKRIVPWILIGYVLIGIILNFFIALRPITCPPCPNGALCGPCPAYAVGPYSLNEIATLDFWKSALLWPIVIFSMLINFF